MLSYELHKTRTGLVTLGEVDEMLRSSSLIDVDPRENHRCGVIENTSILKELYRGTSTKFDDSRYFRQETQKISN